MPKVPCGSQVKEVGWERQIHYHKRLGVILFQVDEDPDRWVWSVWSTTDWDSKELVRGTSKLGAGIENAIAECEAAYYATNPPIPSERQLAAALPIFETKKHLQRVRFRKLLRKWVCGKAEA